MADPLLLNTARGAYRLSAVEQTAAGGGAWVLTLSAEHAGGLEKFAFRCHIAAELLEKAAISDSTAACARIAGWLEGHFEQVREAALKSIRSERRLAEIEFDQGNPGPF
ncbi:MAG TPA: hypothetical protein VGY99_31665 [Candidatus Binataceae bacterium]|jgi:hypothetical protein|nr:hypothetical protein [Candidatus Binataceae bacterium]